MPHVLIKNPKRLDFPLQSGEYHFKYIVSHPLEELIHCRYGQREFFVRKIDKSDDTVLIKLDKVTRFSPVEILKGALKELALLMEGELLFSNLGENTGKNEQNEHSFLLSIDEFIKNFECDKEIWIDVGFGSGRHLLYQAKNNPDIHFIGLEIHKPSIEQVVKQVVLQKLSNVTLLGYDARLVMEFLPSNVVGRIFVHFPVPWDKKPHRRVIRHDFIQESLRVLKVGGTLELRTDSDKYDIYANELFQSYFKEAQYSRFINQEASIRSKYEDRWRKQNKNFYDLILTNTQHSNDITFQELEETFQVTQGYTFDTKAIKQQSCFVRFERKYSGVGMEVLKVSFGDLSKSEHKYLEIQGDVARFFPSKPIPYSANIHSCKMIQKVLCG